MALTNRHMCTHRKCNLISLMQQQKTECARDKTITRNNLNKSETTKYTRKISILCAFICRCSFHKPPTTSHHFRLEKYQQMEEKDSVMFHVWVPKYWRHTIYFGYTRSKWWEFIMVYTLYFGHIFIILHDASRNL